MQKVLSAKVFECKSFDAKAMNAEIAATLILLLRGRLARTRIHAAIIFCCDCEIALAPAVSQECALSDYLFMDVPAHSGDSSIGDL